MLKGAFLLTTEAAQLRQRGALTPLLNFLGNVLQGNCRLGWRSFPQSLRFDLRTFQRVTSILAHSSSVCSLAILQTEAQRMIFSSRGERV